MKFKNYLLVFTLLLGVILSTSSCVVINTKHDNGLHKGWYKSKSHPSKHNHKVHPKQEKEKKKKGKK